MSKSSSTDVTRSRSFCSATPSITARGSRFARKTTEVWQSWTWTEAAQNVRLLAAASPRAGLRAATSSRSWRQQAASLLGFAAVQALGGVPVPLYQDAVADEMAITLTHAEVRFAVAEDQEQVDKLLLIRGRCPSLSGIFYDDPRGLSWYESVVEPLDHLVEEGRPSRKPIPASWRARSIRAGGRISRSSSTRRGRRGNPRGSCYDALITTARNGLQREGLSENEEFLAYLPMAWVGRPLLLRADTRRRVHAELPGESRHGPHRPPRDRTDASSSDRPASGRTCSRRSRSAWRTRAPSRDGCSGSSWRSRAAPARRSWTACGSPFTTASSTCSAGLSSLRASQDVLGLTRVRLAYTAGEAVGPDLFAFFRSLGINIKQFYGMTESSVFICIQPDGGVKPDSAGTPLEGVEVKITESGEVLFRSSGVPGLRQDTETATAAAKTVDGFVKTGDAGFFDDDGHLRIIDRARDVGRLANGSLFAPKYLENKLKFFPHIKEAVAFGHGREYAAGSSSTSTWHSSATGRAQAPGLRGLPRSGGQGRGVRPRARLRREGEPGPRRRTESREFADHPLPHPSEGLDADDGELTRTRKVRRGTIAERSRAIAPLPGCRSTGGRARAFAARPDEWRSRFRRCPTRSS